MLMDRHAGRERDQHAPQIIVLDHPLCASAGRCPLLAGFHLGEFVGDG
jgi:hypothetical protein